MKKNPFSQLFTALILFGFFLVMPGCQVPEALIFKPPGELKTTRLDLQIPEADYKRLRGDTRTKFFLQDPKLSINGEKVKADSIHLRGSSSMFFRRKSYSVELKKDFAFSENQQMEKFFLISMNMDRSYFENVLSFRCMEQLGLFDLYYQYAELWINDSPEGIYLLTQRPNDYALLESGSPYVVRRGANDKLDGEKLAKSTDKSQADNYQQAYKQILSLPKNYSGEELYQAWQKIFDIEAYFRWLAFNYWVRNGDYADELYFYLSPEPKDPIFQIIPWDYDDIFALAPHEGEERRNRHLGSKLLFSSEAEMDRVIANDPFLYRKYQDQLRWVLETLTEEHLNNIMTDIYRELYPYYSKEEVIAMSQYDLSKKTSLNRLKAELSHFQMDMINRRKDTLKKLQKKSP